MIVNKQREIWQVDADTGRLAPLKDKAWVSFYERYANNPGRKSTSRDGRYAAYLETEKEWRGYLRSVIRLRDLKEKKEIWSISGPANF